MTALLDVLGALGAASVPLLWVPLLAWTVLWAVAGAALRAGRGAHPAVRYRTAQAVLLALPLGLGLAATVDVGAFLSWRPAVLPTLPDVGAAPLTGEAAVRVGETGPAPLGSPLALLGAAAGLWALVAVLRLVRLVGHAAALRRLRRALPVAEVDGLDLAVESAAGRVGLGRPVDVVATDADVVPMTFGVWRPLVVVPAALGGERLHLALVHEFVHVRQWDALSQWLEALVGAVFWAHPAVGRLLRQCDLLREMSCDAAVVSTPAVSRHAYAALVSAFVTPPAPAVPAAVGMADSRPHVYQRLSAMKSLPSASVSPRASWLLAAAVLVVGALSVTASGAFAQPGPAVTVATLDGPAPPPLLVVDGDVVAGSLRDLALRPEEIYKVEVLKGDAAQDRYGEAGADGVVLVTTRAAAEAEGLPTRADGSFIEALGAVVGVAELSADDVRLRVARVGADSSLLLRASRLHSGEVISEGEPSVLVVRSNGSGTATDPPLYIVDGVDVGNAPDAVSGLEPSEIASISVLKGESARAQYGEAGANGVILITTKAASGASATAVPAPARLAEEDAPEFSVHSTYPNPATSLVTVTFSLPSDAEVALDVFDATGRRVQSVRPARTQAGPRQSLQIDSAGLATGTYTYRLQAQTADQTYTGSGTFSVVR